MELGKLRKLLYLLTGPLGQKAKENLKFIFAFVPLNRVARFTLSPPFPRIWKDNCDKACSNTRAYQYFLIKFAILFMYTVPASGRAGRSKSLRVHLGVFQFWLLYELEARNFKRAQVNGASAVL